MLLRFFVKGMICSEVVRWTFRTSSGSRISSVRYASSLLVERIVLVIILSHLERVLRSSIKLRSKRVRVDPRLSYVERC